MLGMFRSVRPDGRRVFHQPRIQRKVRQRRLGLKLPVDIKPDGLSPDVHSGQMDKHVLQRGGGHLMPSAVRKPGTEFELSVFDQESEFAGRRTEIQGIPEGPGRIRQCPE